MTTTNIDTPITTSNDESKVNTTTQVILLDATIDVDTEWLKKISDLAKTLFDDIKNKSIKLDITLKTFHRMEFVLEMYGNFDGNPKYEEIIYALLYLNSPDFDKIDSIFRANLSNETNPNNLVNMIKFYECVNSKYIKLLCNDSGHGMLVKIITIVKNKQILKDETICIIENILQEKKIIEEGKKKEKRDNKNVQKLILNLFPH